MDPVEKKQRIVEAASVVLDSTPSKRLGITALNKALFYADLAALRDLGHTITGVVYRALKQGPVVERYEKKLVAALADAGVAEQAPQDDLTNEKPVVLVRPAELTVIDEDEQHVAAVVAKWAASKTAAFLSRYSHDNPGWKIAWEVGGATGHPAAAIDMLVAMQQLCEADPWLQEPADVDLRTRLDGAGLEENAAWE